MLTPILNLRSRLVEMRQLVTDLFSLRAQHDVLPLFSNQAITAGSQYFPWPNGTIRLNIPRDFVGYKNAMVLFKCATLAGGAASMGLHLCYYDPMNEFWVYSSDLGDLTAADTYICAEVNAYPLMGFEVTLDAGTGTADLTLMFH